MGPKMCPSGQNPYLGRVVKIKFSIKTPLYPFFGILNNFHTALSFFFICQNGKFKQGRKKTKTGAVVCSSPNFYKLKQL